MQVFGNAERGEVYVVQRIGRRTPAAYRTQESTVDKLDHENRSLHGHGTTKEPARRRPRVELECKGRLLLDRKGAEMPKALAGYRGKPFSEKAQHVEIENFGAKSGRCVIRISGDDGMTPTLEDGDLLLCAELGSIRQAHSGNLIVVQTDGERIAKRVQFIDGKILLQSENAKPSLYQVKEEDIRNVWKIERKLSVADLQTLSDSYDPLDYLERDIREIKELIESLRKKLLNK